MSKTQLNVRIDSAIDKQFGESVARRRKDKAGVIAKLVAHWIDDETIEDPGLPYLTGPPKNLNDIITDCLINTLKGHAWLNREALFQIQLFREGHSIFGERINHFREEKIALARSMADWLVRRALNYLRQNPNRKAALCLDGGTGNYWVFRFLPASLIKHITDSEFERIEIITNNVAGAICYGAISQQLHADGPPPQLKGKELAEVVNCIPLGGKLLPQYSEVTGPIAVEALIQHKQRLGDKARLFGLAAGLWFELREGTRCPVPLARNQDQVTFKAQMIDKCDEVYALTPLGKLFAQSGQLNSEAQRNAKLSYHPVYEGEQEKIKLVTTSRASGNLRALSEKVHERFNNCELGFPDPAIEFSKVKAILINFAHPKELPPKQEFLLDFPHEYEWDTKFLSDIFMIQPDPVLLNEIRTEYEKV